MAVIVRDLIDSAVSDSAAVRVTPADNDEQYLPSELLAAVDQVFCMCTTIWHQGHTSL